MRNGVRALVVVALVGCGQDSPLSAVRDFAQLGQRTETQERPTVDPGALAGLRSRRVDAADPDRMRVDLEVEAPVTTPPAAAIARAEAAARAVAAEGQVVAVRAVVVVERLPVEVGALAIAVRARDGKGWNGEEVGWRSSQSLVRSAAAPTDEDAGLAAALALAPGDEAARFRAAAAATGASEDRLRAAWDRVRQYLGPVPR